MGGMGWRSSAPGRPRNEFRQSHGRGALLVRRRGGHHDVFRQRGLRATFGPWIGRRYPGGLLRFRERGQCTSSTSNISF